MDVRDAGPERYDEPDYDRLGLLKIILRFAFGAAAVVLLFAILVFVI